MDKIEKRNYLKPYRCFGGFMLILGSFAQMFSLAVIPFTLIAMNLTGENTTLSSELAALFNVAALIYSYYITYKIFLTKYEKRVVPISPIKGNKLVLGLEMAIILVLVRLAWYFWSIIMAKTGYVIPETGTIVEDTTIFTMYACLIAPIVEEIVFRGWLVNVLKRYGTLPAILFTSIAFGIYHGTFTQAVPAIFIGILFSCLALKYDSIIPSIILHIITNSISTFYTGVEFGFGGTVYLALGLVLVLLLLNLKKVINSFKYAKTTLRLSYTSISLITFLVSYGGLIYLSYLGVVLQTLE